MTTASVVQGGDCSQIAITKSMEIETGRIECVDVDWRLLSGAGSFGEEDNMNFFLNIWDATFICTQHLFADILPSY